MRYIVNGFGMQIKKVVISLIILAFITFTSWLYFCPILNQFPMPTGLMSVGYSQYHWSDISLEPEQNEFSVELFYPSAALKNIQKIYAYQPRKMEVLTHVKAANSFLPEFVWCCMLSGVFSYAEPDAIISDMESNYPVIIYLPGIGGDDLHNLYLEELASHGYVVCSIEPPGDVSVSIFLNNKTVFLDSLFKNAIENNDRDAIYAYRNQAHERWNTYITSTIKKLHELNNNQVSIFYKKLDLNRVGLLGHSHGGAVVTDFCQKNNMCKAGVNMDGWTKTYNTGQAFDTPFLFLLSENGEMPETKPFFNNNIRPDFAKKTIIGAGHGAFNDQVLVKQPIARWFGIVTGNSHEIIKKIKESLVRFFDTFLK